MPKRAAPPGARRAFSSAVKRKAPATSVGAISSPWGTRRRRPAITHRRPTAENVKKTSRSGRSRDPGLVIEKSEAKRSQGWIQAETPLAKGLPLHRLTARPCDSGRDDRRDPREDGYRRPGRRLRPAEEDRRE